MIRLIVILWFFIPVLILVMHFGPGQQLMMEDQAGRQIRMANQYEGKDDWNAAAEAYAVARQQLPDNSTELRRRLKIAEAAALNRAGQLDAGRKLLSDVVTEMKADSRTDAFERNRTQHELAMASYYGAWRMRLEGRPVEEWRPIADLACDQLRSLATEARQQATLDTGPRSTNAQRHLRIFRRNLEAAVKMQYMHVTDLEQKELPDMYALETDPSIDPTMPEDSGPSADHTLPEKQETVEETTKEVTEETEEITEEIKEQI